jgi:hypothetical protein
MPLPFRADYGAVGVAWCDPLRPYGNRPDLPQIQFDQSFSTWPYSSSTGDARPKMDTAT